MKETELQEMKLMIKHIITLLESMNCRTEWTFHIELLKKLTKYRDKIQRELLPK